MYKKIEEIYKKKSPYNKIKIKMFSTYLGIVFFLMLFNIIDSIFMIILTTIIAIIIMKKICEKELNTKLYLNFNKKDTSRKRLDEIICEKENELFKNHLRTNQMDNIQTLNCIMEHYRNLVKPKVVSDNFWSIITIVISVLLAFVTKDGFDFNSFKNALPYLISICIIIVMILISVKQFSEIKTFFKGEDGMYERLETIFSELYVESLNRQKGLNIKTTKRNKIKKSKINRPEEKKKVRKQIKKS